MSFIKELEQTRKQATAKPDPWRVRLARLRGKVGYDGVERVSTQSALDLLELPERGRNAGTCRRLAKLMRELGWTPIKARGLTPTGFKDQVRGYARDHSGQALF